LISPTIFFISANSAFDRNLGEIESGMEHELTRYGAARMNQSELASMLGLPRALEQQRHIVALIRYGQFVELFNFHRLRGASE
jgi:hypothetical protein